MRLICEKHWEYQAFGGEPHANTSFDLPNHHWDHISLADLVEEWLVGPPPSSLRFFLWARLDPDPPPMENWDWTTT